MIPPPDKSALRRHMRALRRVLAAQAPGAAARAAELLPMERLPPFAVFGAYRPQGAEMDPGPLVRRLMAGGAQPALPFAAGPQGALEFRLWRPRGRLSPDGLGVPAPGPQAPPVLPDLIVAPLLAFDRKGGRLGQGGGHYDRTLQNLRAAKPVFVLGLAYAGQEVAETPAEPHDQRLDAILTESGYIAAMKEL